MRIVVAVARVVRRRVPTRGLESSRDPHGSWATPSLGSWAVPGLGTWSAIACTLGSWAGDCLGSWARIGPGT